MTTRRASTRNRGFPTYTPTPGAGRGQRSHPQASGAMSRGSVNTVPVLLTEPSSFFNLTAPNLTGFSSLAAWGHSLGIPQ